jgi:hypothetical protein
MSVLDIYQYRYRLSIIMQQVTDTDLADYFQRIDDLDQMN